MKKQFLAEEGFGSWCILSLLLHGAVFAALILLLSNESWRSTAGDTSSALNAASPEKVRQVADDIRSRESEALRVKVNELQHLNEEMKEIQKNAFERLNEFQKMNPPDAEKRLKDAQKRALESETDAARLLQANESNAAIDKQQQAVQAQNEALKELELLPISGKEKALAAQKEAVKLQQDANTAREAASLALQQVQSNVARSVLVEKLVEDAKKSQIAALASQQLAALAVDSMHTAQAGTFTAPSKKEIDTAATIPEIYEAARRVETAITSSYQDARAAELAALQHLPIDDARKLTQTTRPLRPDLDKAVLSAPISNPADLQKQEHEILKARKEISGMIALADSIVSRAKPVANGVKISLASVEQSSIHAQEMEAAALANENTPARDLTGLMQKGGSGGKDKQENSTPGPAGSQTVPPQLPVGDFRAVPGRRISSSKAQIQKGKDGVWMFLDSWYIIGPWPNPNRCNLNTKFPPESVINLDASYQTESGKKVSWNFFQSGTEKIIPPCLGEYEICYAYTELWSQTECDKWIAIGSDDQSKIWINDELVWKSSDVLKGWNPGEGLRKIHLNQGKNRILLRLENGWMQCSFSVIVKL